MHVLEVEQEAAGEFSPIGYLGKYIGKLTHTREVQSEFSRTQKSSLVLLSKRLLEMAKDPSILERPDYLLSESGNPKLAYYFLDHPRERVVVTIKPHGMSVTLEEYSDRGDDIGYVGKAGIKCNEGSIRLLDSRLAENTSISTHLFAHGNSRHILAPQMPPVILQDIRTFFAGKYPENLLAAKRQSS